MSADAGWQDFDPKQQGWQDYQPKAAPTATQEPSAASRFWAGAGAGMGGENALNTKVDPAHPISTNAMIPGAGVYRDIKSGNYAGAAGRVVAPAVELGTALLGAKSGEEVPAAEAHPLNIDKAAAAPIRFAARSAEGVGSIPGVGSTLKVLRNVAHINTPVEDIPPFKMPGRDLGLRKSPPSVYPGAHLPEATPEQLNPSLVSPSRTMPGQISREQTIPTGYGSPLPPRVIPREGPPLQLAGKVQPSRTPEPIRNTAPEQPPVTSQGKVGDLLNEATGGQPLKPNVPLSMQGVPDDFTPVKSSAIKAYKYSPVTREFEAITKGGSHHITGDISPEQVQAFEENPSKGKAWSDLRSGGTPVGKVVNGNRVNTIPPKSLRSATPNSQPPVDNGADLTETLRESLKRAKSAKAR